MGGKSSTISTSEQRVLSLQVQQSSQGLTLPVVYGRTRVAGNLIWYGDFTAIEHKTETRMGGKGGGGGVNQVDVKYTYEAAVMMALCEGTIKGVTRVWRDKEKFTNIAELRLNLAKGGSEQPVWTHLNQAKHQAQALNYSDTAYIYSPNYELTNSAQVYSHNFEVDGKLGYSAHIVDANPRDILVDLLTNHNYGCGFPRENMGDTDVYSVYCRATGIFLSPSYNEQTEAQQNISDLLQQTNSAAVFSQGRLKIIPYGDAQVAGNGALYTPNLTPVYDLTDDDFIVSGANDPVSVERKTNADAYNQVQIEYLDRSNDYNIAVAEAKDQANIEQYGLRPQDAIQMHAICEPKVAQQVAQLLLQRALYVRNEYEFKLGWKYCLLEPMDLVTLTDSGLGLDKKPVRITEIEEDEDGTLTVRAEDFPFGAANATAYPTQPSLGYSADYNVAPGNAHAPVMFEAPLHLTNNEPQIWLATAGGDNWGGAEVWVSTDGDSYVRIGVTNNKARYGSTAAALPAGAVYDNVNTLPVTIGAGHLESTTQQNARDMLTPCYIDGEFLAYETAALTGVGKYTLSKLVRGAWGSSASRHEAGTPFVRLDSALFRYTFDRKWLGKTIWVKLVSFNVFGSGLQELSEVPAYSYRIVGAPLGQVANLRLTSAWTYGKNASVVWDKLDGADSYDIEVYAANSQTRLRSVEGVVDNQYTYTLQDMKADGGQVRNVVFKVRGRAVTGKTGAWAQVVAQNPQLQALQGIEVESGIKQAFFRCTASTEEDFAGIILWVSDNPACPTIDANKVYDGQDTFVVISKCNGKALDGTKRYYLRAAGYDSFDKATLNISQSVAFGVSEVGDLVKEISESSLAQSLKDRINLIDGNGAGSVNARLQSEANARINGIKAAADKAARDLTTKAAEIGTRIGAVENVNATQAQQISTVTAAQADTAAGLETEKRARADGDKAEAAARAMLAARVATAEGNITQEQNARIAAHRSQVEATEALKTRMGNAESSITALQQTTVTPAQAESIADAKISAKFRKPDTRNDNQQPTWYWENYPRQTVSEFKTLRAMGLADASGFTVIDTVVPWMNGSGGAITQTAYLANGTVMRRKSDVAYTYANATYTYTKDQWTAWAADETVAGAQAKADAVKRIADAANALAARTDADFRQFTRTYATEKGAQAERMETLSAKFDNLNVGGRNLIRESGISRLHGYLRTYPLAEAPKVGEIVTVTVWGELGATRTGEIGVYNSAGFNELFKLVKVADGVFRGAGRWALHTAPDGRPQDTHLNLYAYRNDGANNDNRFNKVKLERGSVGTDWTPAPEDVDAAVSAVDAALTEYKRAQATKDAATAERIQTVQTKVNGNSAAIQTHTRSINGLEAQYTVKTDVNGHVAGYGLATTSNNGTPTSKFIVNASQFGIGATGKGTTYPFVVDTVKNRIGINGELVVNGKAIIDNLAAGDITGDKIRANSLHANRLTAGSVTARELAARSINADKLNVTKLSAISADMGDVTAGTMNIRNKFTVGAGGDVTIQSGTGKVGMKITNSNIVVYDGNGRVRAVFGALGVN